MLFALSTGHQIGLAATGAAFILFSLLSSFILPRGNPDFPGRRRNAYVAVCICFFIAMIAAVLVFGKEKKETEAEAATPTTETQPAGDGGEGAGEYANGDAAAGKAVFASSGCAACHTLKAAGATGTVGPSLDDKKPETALIVERVLNGKGPMLPFKEQLSHKQIADVVAFVYDSTHA